MFVWYGGCRSWRTATAWALADVSMGLMAIVNLVAILLLSALPSSWPRTTTTSSRWAACRPSMPTSYPELRSQLEEGICTTW